MTSHLNIEGIICDHWKHTRFFHFAGAVGRSVRCSQQGSGLIVHTSCITASVYYYCGVIPFDSLFDLLEVPHLGRCHGRAVKPQARQAALLRTIVVSHENLF